MVRDWLSRALAVSDAGVRYRAALDASDRQQAPHSLEAYRDALLALRRAAWEELCSLPPSPERLADHSHHGPGY